MLCLVVEKACHIDGLVCTRILYLKPIIGYGN